MTQYSNIFKITHNNLSPSKGNVLIAEPFLQDIYFQRSVVLLTNHSAEGSLGFVLNKKLSLIVNDFFPELEKFASMPIFMGGPVCKDRLFFIHTLDANIIPESQKINDTLSFCGSFDALKEYIISGRPVEGAVKFFLGYSGWDKDQLNNEIEQNSWVVSKDSISNILRAENETFWKDSLNTLGGKYKNWINYPKEPYYN